MDAMGKKAKKRVAVLRTRLTKLQQQLAGAKEQQDDPAELKEIQDEIAAAEKEIALLTGK